MSGYGGSLAQPEVVEFFNQLEKAVDANIRVLDPETSDYFSQALSDEVPDGYPWTRMFSVGRIYAAAFQPSDPNVIMSNRINVHGSAKRQTTRTYESTLHFCRQYAGLEVSNDVVRAIRQGKVGDLMALRIEQMMRTRQLDENRINYGDGTGARAKVQAAASSGDLQVKVKRFDLAGNRYAGEPGAKHLPKGLPIAFYRNGVKLSGGAQDTYRIDANPQVGTAAGVDTITLEDPLDDNLVENDEIAFCTDDVEPYGQEPGGLKVLHDDGTNYPYWRGVHRPAHEGWGQEPELRFSTSVAEGSVGHLQQLEERLFTKVLNDWNSVTGLTSVDAIANKAMWDEMPWGGTLHSTAGLDAIGNQVPVPVETQTVGAQNQVGEFFGGVKKYVFNHPEVRVNRIQDYWANPNTIHLLVTSNVKRLVNQDWELMDSGIKEQRDRNFMWWARRFNLDDGMDGAQSGVIERLKQRDSLLRIR